MAYNKTRLDKSLREQAHAKHKSLLSYLKDLGSAAIAFSGGVDSTYLLVAAREALGERVLALTAKSLSFPGRELEEAVEFCKRNGIAQQIIETNELDVQGFASNPPDRCYICKHHLFGQFLAAAKENDLDSVCEGSNVDDEGDYRPGLRAIAELDIKSPLRQVGLTKQEIRLLSRERGLSTWEKPSFACLSSRFVYGEEITEEKLHMVDQAEQYLLQLGFPQFRVRIHDNMARIEVEKKYFSKVLDHSEQIVSKLKSFGFSYVSMDLTGYRTGSMNEVLNL